MYVQMGQRFKLLMDKQVPGNGFTLLEALLVLLVCSILFLILPIRPMSFSPIFSKDIQFQCLEAQEQAFSNKEEVLVTFKEKEAQFGNSIYSYPEGIVCKPACFHYNFNGNISKGGHVLCSKGKKKFRFVFQIGTGRIRVE